MWTQIRGPVDLQAPMTPEIKARALVTKLRSRLSDQETLTILRQALAWSSDDSDSSLQDAACLALLTAGAIPPLVTLLSSGKEEFKAGAAGVLWQLARVGASRSLIASLGAIPALVQLIRTGTVEGRANATGVLWHLAGQDAILPEIPPATTVGPLVELLQFGPPQGKVKAYAAGVLRCLARHGEETRLRIAKAGAVPLLVALLSSGIPLAKANAAAALGNLAHGSSRSMVLSARPIEPLVALLELDSHPECQENAAAALGSIAVVDETRRRIAAVPQTIPRLVAMLRSATPEAKIDAARTLSRLALYIDNVVKIVEAGAIRPLVTLLRTGAPECRAAAATALTHLARLEEGRSEIAAAEGLRPLVNLLYSGTPAVMEDVAGALMNLSHDDEVSRRMLRMRVVRPFISLLESGTPEGKSRAAAVLANLTHVGDNSSRFNIGTAGAIEPLVAMLRSDASLEGKERAAGALLNLAREESCLVGISQDEEAIPTLLNLLLDPGDGSSSTRLRGEVASLLMHLMLIKDNAPRIAGAIPQLVELLQVQDLREPVAGVLGLLARNEGAASTIAKLDTFARLQRMRMSRDSNAFFLLGALASHMRVSTHAAEPPQQAAQNTPGPGLYYLDTESRENTGQVDYQHREE